MKKIKISEVTGPALDWLVAKCEGGNLRLHTYKGGDPGPPIWVVDFAYDWVELSGLAYSSDWSQGGPIIEREGIAVWESTTPERGKWAAADRRWMDLDPDSEEFLAMPDPYHGPTPLIAAMRCRVISKLGGEVEVPEGLL